MRNSLLGMQVIVRSNEFHDQDLSATLEIADENSRKFLLKLNEPLVTKATTYKYIVASPRLSSNSIDTLKNIGVLSCSVTWVPEDKHNGSEPTDLSWWRGGAAAITDLCAIN